MGNNKNMELFRREEYVMSGLTEYMKKERAINKKWLEYMSNDTNTECPNDHKLWKYKFKDMYIITCIVETCEYYDFNTHRLHITSREQTFYPELSW